MAATYYGVINYGGAYYKPTQFPQNGATSPPAYAGDLNYQAPNNLVAGTFTIFPTGGHATGVVNIAATGTGTSWTASNPFSVTVGSGFASISNYVNLSAISATFDLTLSSLGGIVTISDSTSATSQDYMAAAVVPNAPTGVIAVAGPGQAVISFTESTDNGGSPIIGHTVTSSPGGLTTSVGPPYIITGLTPGQFYTFTVHSTNAVGNGPESAPSAPIQIPIVPPPGSTTGGHFIPQTKKELKAIKRRDREAAERRSDRFRAKGFDAEDIKADLGDALDGKQLPANRQRATTKPAENLVERGPDDDEDDVEFLLLNS